MKWGREEHKAKSVFYWVATLVLIVALVSMFLGIDYISWKDAVGLIKKNMPINGPGSISIQTANYSPFDWQGPLRGRVYLFSDEDLNVLTRKSAWTDGKSYVMDGSFDGLIKGISGIDLPLVRISSEGNPLFISYGKKTITNKTGNHSFEIWTYLLQKGNKVYRKVFDGYDAVDYKITSQIINTYKGQIDPEGAMTAGDVVWLATFSHDSLHKYIISFFEQNKVPELFTKPNIYAYRLDQEISSKVKWIKKYKTEWTGERKGACVGIIYKVDGKTYVRVVYNAWWIGCGGGGGYVFNFWK